MADPCFPLDARRMESSYNASSYNNYYYRQQVSSARPRYIPPPLEKIGNPMPGSSGFYGNYFNSSMLNTSTSGRSNQRSPTYTGLTEVLASYIPGDSTIVFMGSKSSRKWWKGNTAKFLACFFLFTLIVSGVFLYRNGMKFPREYVGYSRPNEIEWTSESEINPKVVIPPKPSHGQDNVIPPNPGPDQYKVANSKVDKSQEPKVIIGSGAEVEDFVKPIQIIYSIDEDDGEVHIESYS